MSSPPPPPPAPEVSSVGQQNRQRGWLTRRGRVVLAAVAGALLVALALRAAAVLTQPARLGLQAVAVKLPMRVPGLAPVSSWPAGARCALDVPGIGALPGQDPDRPVPIGSVAKIMTAYVVLRDHPLPAGQPGPVLTVTATDAADYQARRGTGQSVLPVQAGEHLSERQALQALLIPSANNVATLLARWDRGTVAVFLAQMNAASTGLGLTRTRYTDPSGYDAGTISTADDQVRLTEAALRDAAFAQIVAQRTVTLPGLGVTGNYNTLLAAAGGLDVVGVKTGSTLAAGGNLVFAAHHVVHGHRITLVGAVLGVDIGAPPLQALNRAIAAARTALSHAEATVRQVQAVPAGAVVAEVRPPWDRPVPVVTATALRVLGWPGLPLHLELRTAPVHPGQAGPPIGTITAAISTGAPSPTAAADPGANRPADPAVGVVAETAVQLAGPLPAPGVGWRLRHLL